MASYTVDVPAGPIFSNDNAQTICPIVAAAHQGTWNGQWNTVIPGEMSVCAVAYNAPASGSSSFTIDVPAGPIFSNEDAQIKAPIACASYGGVWNGQWKTVVEGKMSVAGCTINV
ncbi:MAG TPA: mannan-binding lectin [Thermoanaerobaculia bacterium]|jgi:hypothetical protein